MAWKGLTASWLVLAAFFFGPAARGEDWPTWRHDAHRSASSPERLPAELHLQWIRKLGRIRSAWPTERRSQFDGSYEPVVAGRTVLVSAPDEDGVCAFDLETGERRWRFFANGPVRFAPALYRGRAYVVCDDGFLYCLDIADGSLVWKFNAAAADRRHLGNERLVSFWAARGGPVVFADTVYFAAGFWPTLGVFIHAVDGRTGKSVWTNKRCHDLEDVQLDHDFRGPSGLSPQGYLAATADYLIVPNGRSMTAYLDRKTGKLLHYMQGFRQGNWQLSCDGRVITIGNHFYPFRKMLTGENDSFFVDRGKPDPRPMDAHVIGSRFLYGLADGAISCYPIRSIVDPKETEVKKEPIFWWKPGYKYAGAFSYKQYSYSKLWSRQLCGPPPAHRPRGNTVYFYRPAELIKAGDRFYGSRGRMLFAAQIGKTDGAPTLAWKKELDETISRLVAANGKLLVVTEDGTLRCYGARRGRPRHFAIEREPLPEREDRFAASAAGILEATGVSRGYCVVLGVGSGRLIEQLLRSSELRLIVVEKQKQKADAMRLRLIRAGFYGPRAQVIVGDPGAFPFPPFLASLVVSEDWDGAPFGSNAAAPAYLFKMLRPYGGTACVRIGGGHETFAKLVARARLTGATVSRAGDWSLLKRAGALPGAADWTHGRADAGNTLFSRDSFVKPPLGVLWYGASDTYAFYGPKRYDYALNVCPKVARGRLFDVKPKTITVASAGSAARRKHGLVLHAVDVYTGLLLWQKLVPNETGGVPGTQFVAPGDRVYVASGDKLLFIDAVSGGTLKNITLDVKAGPREGPKRDTNVAVFRPIEKGAEWHYLAGSHPRDDGWTRAGYDLTGWKKGRAGFGYGDGDDKTVLRDMFNHYSVVYIRKEFQVDDVARFARLGLMIDYDDGFIAYINGREVARMNVKSGRGKDAKGVEGGEILGRHSFFPLKNLRDILRPGTNVIAIEGHNVAPGSSDFSLDPFLQVGYAPPKLFPVAKDMFVWGDFIGILYGLTANPKKIPAANELLVVLDRKTGRRLWSRRAEYSFNTGGFAVSVNKSAMAAGGGCVFLADTVSPQVLREKKRRGEPYEMTSTLIALELRTGNEKWSHVSKVTGPPGDYLAYSEEAGVLLAYRPGNLRAFDGASGRLLWTRPISTPYSPVMVGPKTFYAFRSLKRIHIAGHIFSCDVRDLATGGIVRKDVFRSELFNCNYALGAENLITLRDVNQYACCIDMGTGKKYRMRNLRSGCTPTFIPADGLIVAPGRLVGCVCNYPVQTALALVPMPEAVRWPGRFPGAGK